MNTSNMGMLSPQEAKILDGVAQGQALFEPTTFVAVGENSQGQVDTPYQSWRFGYYLLDSLVGQEILWSIAYAPDPFGNRSCVIIVVNHLSVPLTMSDLQIYAGEQWTGPSGPDMDLLTGFLSSSVANTVPAGDKEGHAGYAVWSLVNAEMNGAVNAGLSFKADPANFPSGMSLGVLLWNDTLQSICLLASDDATTAQNTALNSSGSGNRTASVSPNNTVNGQSISVNINASIRGLEDPNLELSWLVVVSVTDPNALPFA